MLPSRCPIQLLAAVLLLASGFAAAVLLPSQGSAQETSDSYQGQMSYSTGVSNKVSITSSSSVRSSASASMSPGYDSFSSSRVDISPTNSNGPSRVRVGIQDGATLTSSFRSSSLNGTLDAAAPGSASSAVGTEIVGQASATGVVGDAEIYMNEGTSFTTTTTPRGYTYDAAASALKGTPVYSCQSERCAYQSQNISPDEFNDKLTQTSQSAADAAALVANAEAEQRVQSALNNFANDLLLAQEQAGTLTVIEEKPVAESDYEALKADYRSLASAVLGSNASKALLDQAVKTEFGDAWSAEESYPVVTALAAEEAATLSEQAKQAAFSSYATHVGQIGYQQMYQKTYPDAYKTAYEAAYDQEYRQQLSTWLDQDKAVVYDQQSGSGSAGSNVTTGMDTTVSQNQFTQVFIQAFR